MSRCTELRVKALKLLLLLMAKSNALNYSSEKDIRSSVRFLRLMAPSAMKVRRVVVLMR